MTRKEAKRVRGHSLPVKCRLRDRLDGKKASRGNSQPVERRGGKSHDTGTKANEREALTLCREIKAGEVRTQHESECARCTHRLSSTEAWAKSGYGKKIKGNGCRRSHPVQRSVTS
jgi:hypothetical protein